jgi:hypothetical protein
MSHGRQHGSTNVYKKKKALNLDLPWDSFVCTFPP